MKILFSSVDPRHAHHFGVLVLGAVGNAVPTVSEQDAVRANHDLPHRPRYRGAQWLVDVHHDTTGELPE